jgi:hypothetical protein
MRGGPVNMSEWYFGLDSSMAVYGASGKKMIAVGIPHDGAPLMKRTIEELMPNNTGRCILGLFHGVTVISRNCIRIFSYPWGDFQSQGDPGGVTGCMFNMERDNDTYDVDEGAMDVLYFNEEFGRAIIRDQHRRYFVVDIIAI